MKRSLPRLSDLSQNSTKMLRVVISKQSSPWKQRFSLLWLIGALLVIVVYIMIPVLIILHQIPNILSKLLLAALIMFIAELIVSFILLKIAHPTPAPTVPIQRYRSTRDYPATLLPAQRTILRTGVVRDARIFKDPRQMLGNTSYPTEAVAQVEQGNFRASLKDRKTTDAPFVLPQKLKLPSRAQ